eukprot:gnl/MRDRNA2_/MRDRNA2_158047_c0_seq1.p2 gnl/MRDRNA2_/MRDRNA2_158047_c0~~gnl/MRDRNA2_/MRDRNA2_158047_c0_seq1.p2  ORF type:complete len:105 (-),score=11.76 gnl/MRDRNA2_/MRDRNA2_158047_c0_seq1:736-1014(-)
MTTLSLQQMVKLILFAILCLCFSSTSALRLFQPPECKIINLAPPTPPDGFNKMKYAKQLQEIPRIVHMEWIPKHPERNNGENNANAQQNRKL